jgi:hypothetical protein
MPFELDSAAPHVRTDGGKVVIDVDWDDADSLQEYLRRHSIRSTAYLDRPNRESRLLLWGQEDPDEVKALLDSWDR